MSARMFRIASLIVPSALAGMLATQGSPEPLLLSAAPALVMLWFAMAGAVAMRFVEGRTWEHVDVLTSTGASLTWFAAAALIGSRITGWASLSVIGILGLGLVYVTAAWTAIIAGGSLRWRDAKIARSIIPEIAIEGEPLREELRLAGVRIPIGMRLFVTGQAMKHGVASRYAVGADGSRADLKLESDLGPALRGEHHAPPLALWLGDVLGLTRTPAVHRATAEFTVMPRPGTVDGVARLLGPGGDDAIARPTNKLPTEGTFRIRTYVPGDDTRRIHWVRSAQQDELVVRLPDEVPPADPVVCVILDNELYGTEGLTSRAPAELLDALVRVWLGVGRALSETGTRVTLVTALEQGETIKRFERTLRKRTRDEQRMGARVTWQATVPLQALLGRTSVRQIVVSSRPRRVDLPDTIGWVIVPEVAWTSPEPLVRTDRGLTHVFPSGSAENRRVRRVREQKRLERQWHDRAMFSQVVCWTDWQSFSGHHLARPDGDRIALAVIP